MQNSRRLSNGERFSVYIRRSGARIERWCCSTSEGVSLDAALASGQTHRSAYLASHGIVTEQAHPAFGVGR